MKHFFTSKVWKVLFIAVLLTVVLAVGGSLTGKTVSGSFVQGLLAPFRTGVSYRQYPCGQWRCRQRGQDWEGS